jgi:hypothetical protein
MSVGGATMMRRVPRIARRLVANCGQSLSWMASSVTLVKSRMTAKGP